MKTLEYFYYRLNKAMAKQRGKIGKYSKISLQKKFQLLKMTEFGKKDLKNVHFYLI